ncbi:MAG: YitT family protein [Firmicutes bacterium]|nr:YitT family protein [Candidatus Fiminaster equi]
MKRIEKLQRRTNDFLYNHLWLKYIVEYGFALLATFFSAAIFAFCINVFLQPSVLGGECAGIQSLVSGGSSGAAQVINQIFQLCGVTIPNNPSLLFSIFYLVINLPLVFIAFKFVGKRFGVFTVINIGFVFLLTNVMQGKFFVEIASFVANQGMLARALFAGMCTGLSSAVAYKIDSSAGGFDIVSYYFSEKKSTLTGKYSVIINSVIIAAFSLITAISTKQWGNSVALIFFSAVYLLTVMLVIDVINIRNKKAQIQIITSKKDLVRLLLANIPHGATVTSARGAYSDNERFIIYMVVSTTEIKKAVKVIKELDPESFVNVTSLQQVYGHFHMKPIK